MGLVRQCQLRHLTGHRGLWMDHDIGYSQAIIPLSCPRAQRSSARKFRPGSEFIERLPGSAHQNDVVFGQFHSVPKQHRLTGPVASAAAAGNERNA